jgi:hypothetical protein
MAARRPTPVTETCHWGCGWWATLTADRFAADVTARRDGDLFTWTASPGVQVGDVYLLVTTAPDRRVRAWGWVVGAPDGDDGHGWRVTVRFGGHLTEPLRLKDLREDPALAQWTPLARVMSGRLEGIPPAVWQLLRHHLHPQVAEAAPPPAGPDRVAEPVELPAPQPVRSSRPAERRSEAAPCQHWPWDGLGRGRFFEELVRRVLLPQGFTLVSLQSERDGAGIDVVAHRPQVRWTRWVAQLDVTGEPVDEAAIHELLQGRQCHGAQAALLVATGPVSEAARSLALESQVDIWDAAWLRSAWLRSTDGAAGDLHTAAPAPPVWQQAIAI